MTDAVWWLGAATLAVGGVGVFCFVASWAIEKLLAASRQGKWLLRAAWEMRAARIMQKGKDND